MRRARGWRWPLRILLAGLLCAASGCDLFRPADPEPPSGTGIVPNYIDPDATLATLALAIADKARTNGLTAYLGGFAESTTTSTPAYHHFFWPADAQAWSQTSGRPVPPDWSRPLEQNFYVLFVNQRGDDYQLEWTLDEANQDEIRSSDASIHRRYRVYTLTTDGEITSTIAAGYADLLFVRAASGDWLITRWEDRADPDADPTDPEQLTLGRRRLNTQ